MVIAHEHIRSAHGEVAGGGVNFYERRGSGAGADGKVERLRIGTLIFELAVKINSRSRDGEGPGTRQEQDVAKIVEGGVVVKRCQARAAAELKVGGGAGSGGAATPVGTGPPVVVATAAVPSGLGQDRARDHRQQRERRQHQTGDSKQAWGVGMVWVCGVHCWASHGGGSTLHAPMAGRTRQRVFRARINRRPPERWSLRNSAAAALDDGISAIA